MWKRILLFLSFLAGAIWQWLWEFIRSLFYDRGSRMMAPVIDTITPDQIIHWGPTIVLPIMGLWLFWETRPGKMIRGAEEMPPLLETKTTEPNGSNPLDRTIMVEWRPFKRPEIFPPSGKIGIVGFGSHASGIASQEANGTPGSQAPEWVLEMRKGMHLCHVTNNGEESLIHVQMEFTVIYHAIIEDKNGIRSGDVLGLRQWPLHILQLMPLSQGGSYDLYMWNAGSEVVEITLPKTAKVQRLREIEWREVQLITPLCSGFYIGPNRAS